MLHKSMIRHRKVITTQLHHAKRRQVTNQLRPSPLNIQSTHQLQSKIADVRLPEPTKQFKILCVVTCITISASSLIFLREKLLFGTVAGITAKSLTAPLERLTVFRQASIDHTSSLLLIIRGIYGEEGLAGFWRGWLAGLTSTLITFPLDTVKTVNQATIHHRQWHALHVWYSLALKKGMLRGPWTAALPTCIGASFYYAVKFMVFDACLHGIGVVGDRYGFEMQQDIKHAVGGLVAGTAGNALTFPNNCIRKRMQTAHVCAAIGQQTTFKPLGYVGTAQQFWYHEGGGRRFYKGFGINLFRNAPNTAVQFVVYKRLQSKWNNERLED